MPSPFVTLAGAVVDPEVPGIPAHYGAPHREQHELADGRSVVDLGNRGVITITGVDRLTWLDSLTSQRLSTLTPGGSAETLLLSPNGRIEHDIRVFDDGETTWLLVEGEQTGPLVDFLDRMRFMLRVEVTDRSAEWATVGALMGAAADRSDAPGAEAVQILTRYAASPAGHPLVWHDAWAQPPVTGWQYAAAVSGHGDPHPSSSWRYVEVLVPRGEVSALVTALPAAGVTPAGWLALEALRVEAWRPRQATEVDDRAIPHEFDWMRTAVHLAKGCYRGQETVAKVHNLGHPPRRLVMLHLDGSESVLPRHGDPVYAGSGNDRVQVGIITTPARHGELGGIALALLKRSAPVDADLVVVVGGGEAEVAAAQNVIVPPDAGSVAHVPRLPRLGERRAER
ncbi:hypothetical protein FB466_1623 [Klugiella xanthotipulae]|uniref:GCVT N-terminal domain-containing protein n=2 Tax=Klugiella xanthotipulae TaxID=244735 RepID=A0A543HYE2_9MICO|nr:folate-binding protein YgfZ [Klugiella xanthotipulae]TQM63362.1 hypothetical protein FB466_1623 [Klugiella xanthotipulae]